MVMSGGTEGGLSPHLLVLGRRDADESHQGEMRNLVHADAHHDP